MQQKQKILLIEDDELMRNLYRQTFELNGFAVDVAEDGVAGLEKLKDPAENPTVTMLDIMMPKMNGFDVLKELKQNRHTKDIPVVVISNLAQPEDVDKVMKLGAALYLVKSQHDPTDTVEKIRQVIAKNAA